MAGDQRLLELEARLVKILVACLLASMASIITLTGMLYDAHKTKNQKRNQIAALHHQLSLAVWTVDDERLALRACYDHRWSSLARSIQHVASYPGKQ
jgi:aspartate/tyrosine/aromatic aminotransferase